MPSWRASDGRRWPARFVDTLIVARRRFPGAPASLDGAVPPLCDRSDSPRKARRGHRLRAVGRVYVELLGGRQPGLDFAAPGAGGIAMALPQDRPRAPRGRTPPQSRNWRLIRRCWRRSRRRCGWPEAERGPHTVSVAGIGSAVELRPQQLGEIDRIDH